MTTATDIKKEYARLWHTVFPEDRAWNDWFFENAVDEKNIQMLLGQNLEPISGLLMQPYGFKYFDENLTMAYICGVATYRQYRGHGFMSNLMRDSLQSAYTRGDAFASVIPAERRLFFYYDRFGFATVVYNRMERYTSLHAFSAVENFRVSNPDFKAFHDLETKMPVTVTHTRKDFINILSDIEHDHGVVIQIDDETSSPLAMAFAVVSPSGEIHVRQLLGLYQPALDMALHEVKMKLGAERPLLVWRAAGMVDRLDAPVSLRPRAMMRIVNAEMVLSSLSRQFPTINQIVRVRDSIIKENNAVFRLSDGKIRRYDSTTVVADGRHVTLDLTIDVLTKILFSDEAVGNIFGLPASRPEVSLMLD